MSEIGTGLQNASGIRAAVERAGYAFVEASDMRTALARFGSLADWPAFAESWNDLEVDTYMGDGGRYRKRRFGVYAAERQGAIVRAPHQAHYQTLDYNTLNGGIERWFKPVTEEIGSGASMRTILEYCRALFGRLVPEAKKWHIEVHQFRIEAKTGEAGKPTPEGMHRDGVDYVLVLLINRRNIASGTTTVHDLDKRALGSFTLTDPLDAALVDDSRCYHGVTPVEPENPAQPAYRDVLVVTFKKKP
ncbi:2OG-Fe dioxygenase family protein [uncultured Reyranella sp.]|uniref:2OG-Fe dioxygenase family protein n=1 Tax=uncultured Reyranella sp. TaxID=735512 RepID=UPI0026015948|nr:2OG-Fe dioxygenase family protein [uncultured Reyranella sp.]